MINNTGFNIGEKVIVNDIIDGKNLGGEFTISQLNKINGTNIIFVYFEETGLVVNINEISKL